MPVSTLTTAGNGSWNRFKTYVGSIPSNGSQEDIRVFVCLVGGGASGDNGVHTQQGVSSNQYDVYGGGGAGRNDGLVNTFGVYALSVPYRVGVGNVYNNGSAFLEGVVAGSNGQSSFFAGISAARGTARAGNRARLSKSSGGWSVAFGDASGGGYNGSGSPSNTTFTYTYNAGPNVGQQSATGVRHAGGGGNGAAIVSGGSGFPSNRFRVVNGPSGDTFGGCFGGDGGAYGGGGGGVWGIVTNDRDPGNGRNGAIWVTYVDFINIPTVVQDNVPFNITARSYWDGNQTVSLTGSNTTTNQILGYTYTDSSGARSRVYIETIPPPEIIDFSPTQTRDFGSGSVFGYSSLTGVPQTQLTLSFTAGPYLSSSDINWNIIRTDTNQSVGSGTISSNTSASDSLVVDLPPSVAGSDSPRERSYQLTITDGYNSVSQTITIRWTSDNTPDDYFVPSLNNVEPNTVYSLIPRDVSTGNNVSGMDMNHFVSGGTGVEVSVDSGFTWSTGSLLNTLGGTAGIRARVTSPDFNQDFTGQTNVSQQYSLTIGTVTRFFNITTRAPDVNETFNFPNYNDYVPNPDIDTIPDVDPAPENQSNLYIETDTLDVDDIEIELPIRTDDPNVQVRIRKNGSATFGPWQDITEIGT